MASANIYIYIGEGGEGGGGGIVKMDDYSDKRGRWIAALD